MKMYQLVIFIGLMISNKLNLINGELSKDDFEIWGPGLKPGIIVMPARYFFIKPRNADSCSELLLNVEVEGINKNQKTCRIWTNVLNTQQCMFIIRYKLYETCENLKIIVRYNNKQIGKSPYIISNKVHPEDCSCPAKNIDAWLRNWECGKVPTQIVNDLSVFQDVNFDAIREKIIKKYDNPGAISLCHYVIKDNKINRKCYGKYVGFKMFTDSILLSLSRKIVLPELEFFVNLGDWPLVKDGEESFPIFSWCGSTDSYDIVMPTYDITESTLENMGRVMLDMLSVQGNVKEKWENRIPKLFWRGRDSNRERLNLIDIAREHPDLFNVSLTNFFFFRSEEEKYGPKTEHISFFSFFDYKYQLGIDGTVAAYRLPYLLAGGSLLFKQESKYYEHFYNELIPDVHYIPVKRDLSDLVEKIKWASENDDKAKQIADAGKNFAINKLLPKDIFCYHVFLLREYSKKIISQIKTYDDMEVVSFDDNKCNCDNIRDEL